MKHKHFIVAILLKVNNYFRIIILISITLLISQVIATVVDCNFQWKSSVWGPQFACVATNFRTSLDDRIVMNVTGFKPQKMNQVKEFFALKQSCPYLPLNLGSSFKNLEIFYIMNSNVKHLLNGDLDGLNFLKVFDVSHNPIEQLGQDFFKGTPSIQIVSFYDCHLKIIDSLALCHFVNLREAHFQHNVCIDYHAYDLDMIEDLKVEIADKCNSRMFNTSFDLKFEPKSECQIYESMSFIRRNAYLIISFFGIILIGFSLVLIIIVRKTYNNNWIELKNNLF